MSRKEEAYQKIRDAISYGELKPGERLIENKMCEIFTIGRTPLREALPLLQIEGYVDIFKNKGAVVKKISIKEVEEIYEVVAILESYATEKATRAMSEANLIELKAIQEEMVNCAYKREYRNWLEKNTIFHEYISTFCGNKNLSNVINGMRKRVFRYRLINIMTPQNFQYYMKDHEEILKALFARNVIQSGIAMRKHGFHVKEALTSFLKQNPEF